MTLSITPKMALAFAALALAGLSVAPAAQATPASAMHTGAMHGKKMAAKTVYVCNDCKAYYSASAAKKMHYKDDMGHTLVKASKAPTGYMDGSKMKM
jgi:hypothetical protein